MVASSTAQTAISLFETEIRWLARDKYCLIYFGNEVSNRRAHASMDRKWKEENNNEIQYNYL